MRVQMTDGRVLVGVFLCTDRDRNLILGNASEFIFTPSKFPSSHRFLFHDGEADDESESDPPGQEGQISGQEGQIPGQEGRVLGQEGRVLGLAMVPGQHVVSVKVESTN